MITEEDVIEIVNRYPNLELSINLLKNNTKRLLVFVNSKAFFYGCNLLVQYDYPTQQTEHYIHHNCNHRDSITANYIFGIIVCILQKSLEILANLTKAQFNFGFFNHF